MVRYRECDVSSSHGLVFCFDERCYIIFTLLPHIPITSPYIYQYDETYPEDEKRILTPLGRKQAAHTGTRLGTYLRGINEQFGPCHVKVIRVSDLARAKETAEIIYENLGLENVEIERAEPDSCLNEGR